VIVGIVYLLHLSEPYVPYPGAPPGSCARHYTGFCQGGPRRLARRLRQHGTTNGSPLLLAARRAGITWEVARLWPGTRATERALKRRGSAARYCPACGIVPRETWIPVNRDGSVSRSLTTDRQKRIAGIMTAAELAEHTAIRRGLVAGRVPGVIRLPAVPADDEWQLPAGA
jgi:hypothetical protein